MNIVLSPSSLSDFAKCHRCWWLDKVHQLKWPRGAFPSLPGGVDRVLKDWYDHYRGDRDDPDSGPLLPPELDADGRLDAFMLYGNQANLKRWRFWKTGLQAQVAPGIIVSGALDDLLAPLEASNPYAMLDYKTRGAPPKPGDTEKYYGIQANCYSLMLDANGMKTGGKGYFVYYWPAKGGVKVGSLPTQTGPIIDFAFETEIVEIDTDPQAAAILAVNAAQCLESRMAPASADACEQCAYSLAYKNVLETLRVSV